MGGPPRGCFRTPVQQGRGGGEFLASGAAFTGTSGHTAVQLQIDARSVAVVQHASRAAKVDAVRSDSDAGRIDSARPMHTRSHDPAPSNTAATAMDIAEFEEQDARRQPSRRRERKLTVRAMEGAEQAHLLFNDRVTPAQMDRERREREQARVARLQATTQTNGSAFQKSDLVWARFDRWCVPDCCRARLACCSSSRWWQAQVTQGLQFTLPAHARCSFGHVQAMVARNPHRRLRSTVAPEITGTMDVQLRVSWSWERRPSRLRVLASGTAATVPQARVPVLLLMRRTVRLTARLLPSRFRDEAVMQSDPGGNLKWLPSVASAAASDRLDAEYQSRFDAAVEHADRQDQSDLWPVFYAAMAAAEQAAAARCAASGVEHSAPIDAVQHHGIGAEFRRMLGSATQNATPNPKQLYWAMRPEQRNGWWPAQILQQPPNTDLKTRFITVRFAGYAEKLQIQSSLVRRTLPRRCEAAPQWNPSQLSRVMTNPLYHNQPAYRLNGSLPEDCRSYGEWVAHNKRDFFLAEGRKARRELKQIMESLIGEVEQDEHIRNEIKPLLSDMVETISNGTAAASVTEKDLPRAWPAEQDLVHPMSYAEQLTLCLRKRGGLVSDRHKDTARLRLPPEQRALQQKMLADWSQPSAESVTDVNQKLQKAFGARTFRPGI
eukprot:COSAG03_NODE_198_length_10790_cov_17.850996_3_plen_663_part_00